MEELRAYHFQIMYLQGIHAGIQTQHCTVEMFLNYEGLCSKPARLLDRWARDHKTTIVLNGGYASSLSSLVDLLDKEGNPYPWGYFRESKEALNGCITNVGIILPKYIYNPTCSEIQKFTTLQNEIHMRVISCRLMN